MTINKTINIEQIRHFFTQKEPVSLFLGMMALFVILWVVFAEPSNWPIAWSSGESHPLLNATAVVAVGFGLTLASRLTLRKMMQKHNLPPGWWIAIEYVGCVAAMTAATWLIDGCGKIQLGRAAGNACLGLAGLEVVPYVVAFLASRLLEEQAEVARLRALLPDEKEVAVPQSSGSIDFYDKGGRLVFATQIENVLYIEAADNYTNIHYLNEEREETFILHNSMKEIESRYASRGLVRCQRGYMVNIANVKLMRKEANGFTLELNRTSRTIPVSKNYAAEVTSRFQTQR